MRSWLFSTVLALAATGTHGATVWQQRNVSFDVPVSILGVFASKNFTSKAEALSRFEAAFDASKIARSGDFGYGATIARVWTQQRKTYPEMIVFPETPQDVSIIMQFYSAAHSFWGDDGFAIMCGGHADFGGGQSPSVIIDMYKFSETEFATTPNVSTAANDSWPILKIGGGNNGGDVYSALDGTGWAFLGPRAASVGVGGFVLGGGIAFQSSRYGYAADNLVGVEMVLLDGSIIYANPYNEYEDLFWACTGAGWIGLGVVTNFYIQAYPDPGVAYATTVTWKEDQAAQLFETTADFFTNNQDPDVAPVIIYYFKDATLPDTVVPLRERGFTFQLDAIHFGGDLAKVNATFGKFFTGASTIKIQALTLRTLDQYLTNNYPYGHQRVFYGNGNTRATPEFFNQTFSIYKDTVNGIIARGEDPGHTFWIDEYIFPGLNQNSPSSSSDTAWPHATTSHFTLMMVEWANHSNQAYVYDQVENHMTAYVREFQAELGDPPIYDYPNYIAPHSIASEVWGEANFNRMVTIKEKYDPLCLFNRGRVIATAACVQKGLATTYANYSTGGYVA